MAVGRAIVCQQSWQDPAVIDSSGVAFLRTFNEAYEGQRLAEIVEYKEGSYYKGGSGEPLKRGRCLASLRCRLLDCRRGS